MLACAVAGSLGVSACVAPAPMQALRVEPNLRLSHAGPGPAQGYVALARRYEGEGRWPEALQAWHKAAQAAPGDASVHDALAQAQAAAGDHTAAVAALRHAVALAPDQPALHNNLGYALMRAGQAQEARTALLQALVLQPGYARAQANLNRLAAAPGPTLTQAASAVEAAGASQEAPAVAGVAGVQAVAAVQAAPAPAPPASPASPSSPASAAEPAAQALVPARQARTVPAQRVEIANGNGVEGMASCLAELLRSHGAADAIRLRNALPYDTTTTVVRYRPGHVQAAQALASHLPGGVATVAGMDRADSLDLRIVLGHDLRTSGLCSRRG
jgi:Flp pilus assembly protein TadD